MVAISVMRPPERPTVTLWHNPACSKSRATLALFEQLGWMELRLVAYLEQPPSAERLREVLGYLGLPARALLRTTEAPYRSLQLEDPARTEAELVEAMASHPILIQRPVAICGERAAIGRPPYRALSVLAPAGEPPPVHEVLKSKIKEEGI